MQTNTSFRRVDKIKCLNFVCWRRPYTSFLQEPVLHSIIFIRTIAIPLYVFGVFIILIEFIVNQTITFKRNQLKCTWFFEIFIPFGLILLCFILVCLEKEENKNVMMSSLGKSKWGPHAPWVRKEQVKWNLSTRLLYTFRSFYGNLLALIINRGLGRIQDSVKGGFERGFVDSLKGTFEQK